MNIFLYCSSIFYQIEKYDVVSKKERKWLYIAAAPGIQTWVGSGLLYFKQGGLSIIGFL